MIAEYKDLTGIDIAKNRRLAAWLVRHIGWAYTRFQKRTDGNTPYYMMRGKDYKGFHEKFGSCVMIKQVDSDDQKLEPRWQKAVYVGKTEETDEHVGLTPTGVIKGRSCKPLAQPESWDRAFIQTCIGLPWNAREDPAKENLQAKPILGPGQIKGMYITQKMIAEHGPTSGCPACAGISMKHSPLCRM